MSNVMNDGNCISIDRGIKRFYNSLDMAILHIGSIYYQFDDLTCSKRENMKITDLCQLYFSSIPHTELTMINGCLLKFSTIKTMTYHNKQQMLEIQFNNHCQSIKVGKRDINKYLDAWIDYKSKS